MPVPAALPPLAIYALRAAAVGARNPLLVGFAMRRLAVAFVALALGAALLFLLFSDPGTAEGVPVRETPAETDGESLPPAEERDAAGVDADAEERAEEIDTTRTIRVVVLRQGDRTPVAGARVAAFDWHEFSARNAKAGHLLDRDERAALAERLSSSVTSGAEGLALVPVLGKRMIVTATQGALWGRRMVSEVTDARVELLVSEDRTLRVAVVDRGGVGVPGVWVAVCRREDGGYLNRKTAGSAALATFPHVQESLAKHPEMWARLGFPLRDPQRIPVTLSEFPRDALRLDMPPTGSLTIRVRDEKGRAVPGAELALRVLAYETAQRDEPVFERGFWSHPRVGEEGVARVPHLGLGFHLRVRATARGDSLHRPVVVDVPGPRRPGEDVVCDVLWRSAEDPRSRFPAITGRFVRRDGTPWSRAEFYGWIEIFPRPKDFYSSVDLPLDGDGRFRLPLKTACPQGGRRVLHLNPKQGKGVDSTKLVRGQIDLSRQFPPGTTDLGDVVFDHGEHLASGIVVDQDGAPLPKAMVRVCMHVKGNRGDLWPTVTSSGTEGVAADGTFAIHALPGAKLTSTRMRLSVHCDGFPGWKYEEFRLGARDLRVVLRRGGVLRGSVRLLEGQSVEDIAVVLKDAADVGRVPKLAEDGSFAQEDLKAGTYRLVAYFRSPSGEARRKSRVVVEDLIVVPGQVNRDPRIQGMEVRGSVQKLEVRVVDAEGKPIERASVSVTGIAEGQSSTTGRDGRLVLRLASLPVNLHVTAFGYRPETRKNVETAQRIRLRGALRVKLRTAARPHGKDPEYRLGFYLFHVDQKGRRGGKAYGYVFPWDREYFDAEGEARVPLPSPGVYELVPRVYVPGKDNVGRGGYVDLKPHPRFTVRETPELQEFEIPIPQGFVDTAVKKYAK